MWLDITASVLLTGIIVYTLAVFERWGLKKTLVPKAVESFYDLENWDKDLYKLFFGGGLMGCNIVVLLIFSPLRGLLICFGNVRYAITNIKYYLPGGRSMRLGCAKTCIIQKIKILEEMGNNISSKMSMVGRTRVWYIEDLIETNDYEGFVNDYFLTPVLFWKRVVLGVLGLLLWPLAIVLGVFGFSFGFEKKNPDWKTIRA